MPIVPAICSHCGARLEVDSDKEAWVCQYCGTPFVVEKAINNYTATYVTHIDSLHADTVKIENEHSRENRVKAGNTYLKLNDYASAERIFSQLTEDFPYDCRGWLGLIEARSRMYTLTELDRAKLSEIRGYYRNACAVADPGQLAEVEESINSYFRRVEEYRSKRKKDLQTKKDRLRENYRRKRELFEAQLDEMGKKRRRNLWLFGCALLVLEVVIALCAGVQDALFICLVFNIFLIPVLFVLTIPLSSRYNEERAEIEAEKETAELTYNRDLAQIQNEINNA